MPQELTKITDQLLMEIRDKSDNPIYKMTAPGQVWPMFKKQFPDIKCNTVLQMMALLAGDVVTVNCGRKKFFFMLPEEEHILNALNRNTQAHNRVARQRNKEIRAAQRESALRAADEMGIGDIFRKLDNLSNK